MRLFFTKFLSLTCIWMLFLLPLHAEIKSPNYDFTLASLEAFFPGKNIKEIETEIKKNKANLSDIFEDNGNMKIWRFKIHKTNYILDVYAQTKNDVVTDAYVRLPQHFYHDLILADLQKRYKKQDRFVKKDLSALYVWLNRDGNNILYHGSCSITCFPMFVEIVSMDKSVVPLYNKFNEALPKW